MNIQIKLFGDIVIKFVLYFEMYRVATLLMIQIKY